MIEKIKKYFSEWNKFESYFLIIGIVISILSSLIFNGTIIYTLYTLTYFITTLLTAKGKVECFFVGFVSVFFYAIISFNQAYYGELLITVFLTMPIMIIGIVSWLKHKAQEENVVIINELSKKEVIMAFVSQLIFFWIYYFILNMFNTDLLIISSISIVVSVLATYFEARRSEISIYCYTINDIILIILWLIPVLSGDKGLITVLIGLVLLLITDLYGIYNWNILKKKQKNKFSKGVNYGINKNN